MVNIELYRIFIAIYRAGTISKAALLCDITQPAASQQLAMLEKTLKVKLYERTPRKMVATNEGHELYTKVSDSFDWLDFVSQDFLLNRSEEKPLFHLGLPMEFYTQEMVKKINNFPFRLELHFGTTQELTILLKSTKIDAMVSTQFLNIPRVHNDPIFKEIFCLIGHKSIEIPSSGFENWNQVRGWFMQQNWIAYDSELSIIRRYFKTLYKLRPNIHPSLIVANLQSIVETLKFCKGVSVLPLYLAQDAIDKGELKIIHQPQPTIENKLYLSYENHSKNRLLVQGLGKLF
jgi:DNA-binding transcriptional LysR family regulator